jgi:uncharacterized DUF497 family protein
MPSKKTSAQAELVITLQFDWDSENIEHFAKHQIAPSEAEQVILNRPVDLEAELRNGEERVTQIGETDAGRILIVVSTTQGKERLRRYFQTQKRNRNVGRIEEQDLRE